MSNDEAGHKVANDSKQAQQRSVVSASPAPPIDASVLATVRKDFDDQDGAILLALIAAFVDAADLFECVTLLPSSEGQLAQSAQQLRGTAVMVGAGQVGHLCQQLETADRAGNLELVTRLVGSLLPAIRAAKAMLARIVSKVPSPSAGP